MPTTPVLLATVNITAKDINGNNVAKQYNSVSNIIIDYFDGTINVIDRTGSFYFPFSPATTFTYTIVGTLHTIVIS